MVTLRPMRVAAGRPVGEELQGGAAAGGERGGRVEGEPGGGKGLSAPAEDVHGQSTSSRVRFMCVHCCCMSS
jgi:hypothetical protein